MGKAQTTTSVFDESSIRVPFEPIVDVAPNISYSASNLATRLFDLPIVEGPSFTHHFDLMVSPDSYFVVEEPERALVRLADSGHWDFLRGLPGAIFAHDPVDECEAFVVARLTVYEWIELHRTAARASWFDVLDVEADPAGLAGIIAEISSDDEGRYEMALIDGSLFLLKGLHVHSSFRGQSIGIRLMAHAIQALHRCTGDLFVCQAMPLKSIFAAQDSAEPEPDRSRNAVKRLASYYRRLGLRTWKKSITAGEPIVLWQLGSTRFAWE